VGKVLFRKKKREPLRGEKGMSESIHPHGNEEKKKRVLCLDV